MKKRLTSVLLTLALLGCYACSATDSTPARRPAAGGPKATVPADRDDLSPAAGGPTEAPGQAASPSAGLDLSGLFSFKDGLTAPDAAQEEADGAPDLLPPGQVEEPDAPAAPAAPSSVRVDLSDPAMYQKVNVFLSNFSETGFARDRAFSTGSPDYGDLIRFALWHDCFNNPHLLEDIDPADYGDRFPDFAQPTVRLPKSRARQSVQTFFGSAVALPRRADAAAGVMEDDSYYYAAFTGGEYAQGFVLTDRVTDLGGELFQAEFQVYVPRQPGYDPTNPALYSARPQELSRLFPQEDFLPQWTGTATFQAVGNGKGGVSFQLRSYKLG